MQETKFGRHDANCCLTPRDEIVQAHTHSSGHKIELLNSRLCGCFYCLTVFAPSKIDDWLNDECARCPNCGIDSVIGSASGYPITKEFLQEMKDYWFRCES